MSEGRINFKKKALIIALVSIVAILSGLQSSYADTVHYRDHDLERNENGTYTITLNVPERVWDGAQWVSRIIQNNGTHYNVYSQQGSFSFSKSDCTITQYVPGFDPTTQDADAQDVMIGKWFWTIARKDGANPWQVVDASAFTCGISSLSNSTGKFLTMTRVDPGSGSYIQVKLAGRDGEPVEDYTKLYMNKAAWSGNKFAFVIWAKDARSDSITMRNGTTLAIPEGTTVIDRSQLNANSLDFVRNGNAFFFDWLKAESDFKTLLLNKTGTALDVQFGFNNNPTTLVTGQSMQMDPTFGYHVGTIYRVETAAGAGAACNAASAVSSSATPFVSKEDTGYAGGGPCTRGSSQVDITAIPDSSTIQAVSVKYVISSFTGVGINCDINSIESKPSTATAANLWTDIGDGTAFSSNNSWCATSGTKTISLPASAVSDLQANLVDNWWAWGTKFNDEVRDGNDHKVNLSGGPQLQVTYTVVPLSISTLEAETASLTGIDISWTAPDFRNETLTGYGINYTRVSTWAWNILNAEYIKTKSVVAQDTVPQDMAFSSDGTKMYVVGNTNNSVYEYTLTTAWDISTASYLQTKSVTAQDTSPQGMAFSSDGTKMYVVGDANDSVYEYTMTTAWDISTASYLQTKSVVAQDTAPTGMAFSSDGTKMYVVGDANDSVYEYTMTTAWDISTASYLQTKSVVAQDTVPQDMAFSSDGTKMYVVGSTNDSVYEYNLLYLSPLVANTYSSSTSYSVTDLSENTEYAFRVTAITTGGSNITGANIATATTGFVPANFTIGNVNFDTENPERAPISFSQSAANSTLTLTVRYLASYDMDCNFHTVMGQDDLTYSNLNGTTDSTDSRFDTFAFTFANYTNDVVNVRCWDTNTNDTGVYQLTQSDFILKQLLDNFRNGTYGTHGQLGVLDLIGVIVVIFAMIGFNRTNETVAVFFGIAILGALTYFGIVSWPAALFSGLAFAAFLIISTTRKN